MAKVLINETRNLIGIIIPINTGIRQVLPVHPVIESCLYEKKMNPALSRARRGNHPGARNVPH